MEAILGLNIGKAKQRANREGEKTRNKIVENLVCSRTFLNGELKNSMN